MSVIAGGLRSYCSGGLRSYCSGWPGQCIPRARRHWTRRRADGRDDCNHLTRYQRQRLYRAPSGAPAGRARRAGADTLDLEDGTPANPEVGVIRGSICDQETVREALSGVHRLYHLAANPYLWPPGRRTIWRSIFHGTRTVLETAARFDLERIVYTSTESILVGHHHRPAALVQTANQPANRRERDHIGQQRNAQRPTGSHRLPVSSSERPKMAAETKPQTSQGCVPGGPSMGNKPGF